MRFFCIYGVLQSAKTEIKRRKNINMRYYRIGMQEVCKRNDAIVYIMNNKKINDEISQKE